MRRKQSKEEVIAKKLATAISDLTLDLDEVGVALATEPTVLADRLVVVLESTREQKEKMHERRYFI